MIIGFSVFLYLRWLYGFAQQAQRWQPYWPRSR
jgi:hypothetical protein